MKSESDNESEYIGELLFQIENLKQTMRINECTSNYLANELKKTETINDKLRDALCRALNNYENGYAIDANRIRDVLGSVPKSKKENNMTQSALSCNAGTCDDPVHARPLSYKEELLDLAKWIVRGPRDMDTNHAMFEKAKQLLASAEKGE